MDRHRVFSVIEQVPVPGELEDNYGEKVRVGLIALCHDLAMDRDFARMIPDDRVALVTSRIFLEQPNSKRTFTGMAGRIPDVVRLLCPLLRLDSIVFGCTSATSQCLSWNLRFRPLRPKRAESTTSQQKPWRRMALHEGKSEVLRLPPAPPPRAGGAGKKETAGRRLNRACPPSVTPSSIS